MVLSLFVLLPVDKDDEYKPINNDANASPRVQSITSRRSSQAISSIVGNKLESIIVECGGSNERTKR